MSEAQSKLYSPVKTSKYFQQSRFSNDGLSSPKNAPDSPKRTGIQYSLPIKINKKAHQIVKNVNAHFYNTHTNAFIQQQQPFSHRQTSPRNRDASPGIDTSHMNDQQIQELVVELNKKAMMQLKQNQNEECYRLLKSAEVILKDRNPMKMIKSDNDWQGSYFILQSMTQNNLGCYYKKMNSPQVALHYMKKAQRNENVLSTNDISKATTQLNICAVLSKLNKHSEAIQYAQSGIKILRQQINEYQFMNKKNSTDIGLIQEEPEQEINDSLQVSKQDIVNQDIHIQSAPNTKKEDLLKNMYSTLIVAYHNLGVEFEYLKDYQGALEAYQNAIEYSKTLDQHVPIVDTIRGAINEIENKMHQQEERFHLRDSKRQITVFKQTSAANSRHGSNQRSIKNETAANFQLKYPSALQDLPWSSLKNSFTKNTPQQQYSNNSSQLQKRQLIRKRIMNQDYSIKKAYMLENVNADFRVDHQINSTFAIKPRQLEQNQNQSIENSDMVLAFSQRHDPLSQTGNIQSQQPQFTSYYNKRSNERLSDMQLVQYKVKSTRYSSVRRPQKLEKIQDTRPSQKLSPKKEAINAYDSNIRKFYTNQRIYQSKETEKTHAGLMSPDSMGGDTADQFNFFQDVGGSNFNFNSSLLSQRYNLGFNQQDQQNSKVSTPDSGTQRHKFYKTQMRQQREKTAERLTHSSNAQARQRQINFQDPVVTSTNHHHNQQSNKHLQSQKGEGQIESPVQPRRSQIKKQIEQEKLNAWQQQQLNDKNLTLQEKVDNQLIENRKQEESQELKQQNVNKVEFQVEIEEIPQPAVLSDNSSTILEKIDKVPLKQSNTQYDMERNNEQTMQIQEYFNSMHIQNLDNDIQLPLDIKILSDKGGIISQQISMKTANTPAYKQSLNLQTDRSFEVKSSAMTVKRDDRGNIHHEQSMNERSELGQVIASRQSIETEIINKPQNR